MLAEEVGGGVIGLDPAFLSEKAVDFIREDELLKIDALLAEGFHQCDSLMERNIAIVIAMDEQDGRSPGIN